MIKGVLIIGGDKRQKYLDRILREKISNVFHIADSADERELDNIRDYSHIILPVPVTKDKRTIFSDSDIKIDIEYLTEKLLPYHRVFGAGSNSEIISKIENRGAIHIDFMKDKNFKLANAYLTSQGAAELLLNSTEDYIVGKKALILGCGDVAVTLAEKLCRLGLDVYIAARKPEQLSLASLSGYKTVRLSSVSSCIYLFDFVFGTIPSNVLTSEDIRSMNDSSIYFELASAPFTAKQENFITHRKKYIGGSGLPGRFLPEASAKLMAEFIFNNLWLKE